MQLAILFGGINPRIATSIGIIDDSISVHEFLSVEEMLRVSEQRRIFFYRLILNEKFLKDGDIELLNEYVKEVAPSTDIVLVCNKNAPKWDKTFLSVLNSPKYTPVLLSTLTSDIITQLVSLDVLGLKMEYYSSETSSVKTATSRGAAPKEDVVEAVPATVTKPNKRGVFDALFGRRGFPPETQELQNAGRGLSDGGESAPVSDQTENYDFNDLSAGSFGETPMTEDETGENTESEDEQVLFSGDVVPSGDDHENSGDGFDDLSVAGFGYSHSDTGFLDEEALAEELVVSADEEVPQEAGEEYISQPVVDPDRVVIEPVLEEFSSKVSPRPDVKVKIYLGIRGAGISGRVVTIANGLATERGKSVLIVDLDYKANGVLSYLSDTELFYRAGHFNGLENKRFYSEDGVDILSNGSGGSPITAQRVAELLTSPMLSDYDAVLVDCPLDCCHLLSLLEGFVMEIGVAGNKGSLMDTCFQISNRSVVPLSLEKELNAASVHLTSHSDYLKEDLQFIKAVGVFPNGCWLDKVKVVD